MLKKHKLLIFGIVSGLLVLSIIAGVVISNRPDKIFGVSSNETAEVFTEEIPANQDEPTNEILGENGFKIIMEETDNVPAEIYPNPLAERSLEWKSARGESVREKYAEFFTKDGGTTTVKIKKNKTVKFIDESYYRGESFIYNYMFFIPEIYSHLIDYSYSSGGYYILVNNETGITEDLWELPSISPDKNRFATANKDFWGDFPKTIQIFEIISGKYIKLFDQKLNWGPGNIRWLSNDSFVVDKYVDCCEEEKLTGQVIFKLVKNK